MKVAVVMSAYNGEKFIREQLDSIFAQTGVEVFLHVRDDGSNDGTADILREYLGAHANAMSVDFGQNEGVGNSFMHALCAVANDYDYYAFADQDDVWLPEKLIRAIEFLRENGGILYGSNQLCVDADGNEIGMRYAADKKINLTATEILFANNIAGCTMVFGRDLFELLTAKDRRASADMLNVRIHDVWVAVVAALYGNIVYDDRAFIKYRQHGNNVVGASAPRRSKVIKSRIKKVFDRKSARARSSVANELMKKHNEKAQDCPEIVLCSGVDTAAGRRRLIKNIGAIMPYANESETLLKAKIRLKLF